jgi:NitT/TauT family transport system permease protein
MALFAAFLASWQLSIMWFQVPAFLLPSPLSVAQSLWNGIVEGTLYPHVLATLTSTVSGYLVGCSLAILLGGLLSEFPLAERLMSPYIVAFQSMPKVALAPLIIVWFGYGVLSKIVMVALICFFPVFVNTLVGLNAVDNNLLSLYRVFSASRLSVFFNVKLPSAAGGIFAGLQIAVAMALIGAVVAEFVASRVGLGNLIQSAAVNLDVATMFACVLLLALIGVTGSWALRSLHRRVVFWENRANRANATR